ncbi:MAG: hypothetical protein A2X66_05325 [Ignavibacteria bacterium GWA2_54_16]|nr:MAG: hypothetical protein A2X66_05325 [Ignavibacteria bacterium GWA2_54_16]
MNTAFDPTMLFISDAEWRDEAIRDRFLTHLSGHLRMVEEYQLSKIYWSDYLEQYLWNHPQLPPWRSEIHWKNVIVPIIARLFAKNVLRLDTSIYEEASSVTPPLSRKYGREEIDLCFRQLLHVVIQKNEPLRFNPGVENICVNGYFEFSCECHNRTVKPRIINLPEDWLDEIDFTTFWPRNVREVLVLRKAIDVVTVRELHSKTVDRKYKFEFDNRFVRDIIDEQDCRIDLLWGLAKRLLMTQAQASIDKGLLDEEIAGGQERRMRISRGKRVHYVYSGQGSIRFMRFYGEGEHDEGLR